MLLTIMLSHIHPVTCIYTTFNFYLLSCSPIHPYSHSYQSSSGLLFSSHLHSLPYTCFLNWSATSSHYNNTISAGQTRPRTLLLMSRLVMLKMVHYGTYPKTISTIVIYIKDTLFNGSYFCTYLWYKMVY